MHVSIVAIIPIAASLQNEIYKRLFKPLLSL